MPSMMKTMMICYKHFYAYRVLEILEIVNIRVEDHLWQWDMGYSFRLLDEEPKVISKFNSSFYSDYKNLDSGYMPSWHFVHSVVP